MSRVAAKQLAHKLFPLEVPPFPFVRPPNRAQLFLLSLPPRAWAAAASLVSHWVCKKTPLTSTPTHPPLLSPPSTPKRCLPNDTESNYRTFQHPVSRAGTRLQGHSPCARDWFASARPPAVAASSFGCLRPRAHGIDRGTRTRTSNCLCVFFFFF